MLDKNEKKLFQDSKLQGNSLRFYLDIGICIDSPVIDFDDNGLLVNDKNGNEMCLALDTITSISL
ncbi:hypothetical protein L1267_10815 [Pseudoalteromonas sp. OFAV1]|jgi:hypothetical protein|uniref:hypothetical protein n=1 Tax=Pseudoalteromonas sp. OFAV1 TaxID=2908892 RepID=UPI001F20A431|nr:hypothetical protein [Pseudoalteromonas sp. OFAV1]MCF2900894.1 hypothetical protein [Pseudoalteromonas sp. OFAV1]